MFAFIIRVFKWWTCIIVNELKNLILLEGNVLFNSNEREVKEKPKFKDISEQDIGRILYNVFAIFLIELIAASRG